MSRVVALVVLVLLVGCHPNDNSKSQDQEVKRHGVAATDQILDEEADVKVVPDDQQVEQDQTIVEKPEMGETAIKSGEENLNSKRRSTTDKNSSTADGATDTATERQKSSDQDASKTAASKKVNDLSHDEQVKMRDTGASNSDTQDDDRTANKKSSQVSNDQTSRPAPSDIEVETALSKIDHQHKAWDKLLKKYVDAAGLVDYDTWYSEMAGLDSYLVTLQGAQGIKSWTADQQLAYWINSYNAHTIKLVLESYPVKSIKKLNGGQPWKMVWIPSEIGELSLDAIENEIIRPQFGEPKIHFALVCAAISCPVLSQDAYTASKLDEQLEISTRKFMNSQWNQISPTEMKLSPLFDWYAADFGDVKEFVRKYSRVPLEDEVSISYTSYDWNLNKQ